MNTERNIYLKTIPASEAVARVTGALKRETLLKCESVASANAAGRILAAPVFAACSSPTFDSAAMDGVALAARDTFAAREGAPVRLAKDRDFVWVNTGNPLPRGFDAVVMVEQVRTLKNGDIELEAPAFPWQHVRRLGEDIIATELLFPQHTRLNAYDVGALLSGGIWNVSVYEKPRVRIIPTGDEVRDFTRRPDPQAGEVVESNSQVLKILAENLGCEAERVPPVGDDRAKLQEAVQSALNGGPHVVVLCAGSSAGSKDFTRSAFETFGTVLVHGIAIMPGKPSIAAVTGDGRLLVGAPGYPVSSVVCFEELLAPVLRWLMRAAPEQRQTIEATVTRKLSSRPGMEELVRVSVGKVGERYVAGPLQRSAGCITSLTRAQGVVRIPAGSEGLEAGTKAPVELLRGAARLDDVLICTGSHDNVLDLISDRLMNETPAVSLTSTHVGSMGGLTALKDRNCHLAGIHLFDPESGDFNFPFLEKYLPGLPLTLVNLVVRHQGLIVASGNPKNISGVKDLARADVRFVNRQRGSGTRILLDYHLKHEGIQPDAVQGYVKEEFTHMGVAVNVLSGNADCGLGVMSAARALHLDFVPLALERYDLAVPQAFMEDPKITALLRLIERPDFQEAVRAMGGYETWMTGQVMQPGRKLKR